MGKILKANDIAEVLGVSKNSGYRIIRQLNGELQAKGFMTFEGRVSARYFYERFGLERG